MGLLDNILNNLLSPPDQERSSREFGPGLSAIAGASSPIGFASDAALAFNNNEFANFLGEDQKRRAQILQLLQSLPPERRLELANQLQASRPTLEGTFATPGFGRVLANSLGLLGSIGAGARVAGAGARGLGLREPLTQSVAQGELIGGFGKFAEKFAPRTGRFQSKASPDTARFAASQARAAVDKAARFTKDTAGRFTGSR